MIVRVAAREIPPYLAVMVTVVFAATDAVSIVKDALELRAGTVTAAGTFATSLLLVSNTTFAVDSVAVVKVTIPVGCPCCRIVEGEMPSDCSVAVAAEGDGGAGVDDEGGGSGGGVTGVDGATTAEGPSCWEELSELPLLTSPHAVNVSIKMYPTTHPVVFITGLPFLRALNDGDAQECRSNRRGGDERDRWIATGCGCRPLSIVFASSRRY